VRLDEIEYADPNCFISLNMILLFNGSYHSGQDVFIVKMVEQPPLHGSKSLKFKEYEQDYFGAYAKMQR